MKRWSRRCVACLSFLALATQALPGLSQTTHKPVASASSAAGDQALAQGVEALQHNDAASAVVAFRTVTKLRPQFAEGFLNLGLALEQEKTYPEAASALEKAQSLKPTLRGANLFLGIADYQLSRFDQAVVALKREIRLSPKDPKAWMWLGLSQVAAGHVEDGAASLDAAYAITPKDPDVLYHRGYAHLLVSKSSYQEMFAVDPDSYRVHEVLGQADAEADRTSDAIGEYKLAIERASRTLGLHEELGDLYWVSGSMDLADEAYEQELALDPYSFTSYYKLGSLRVIVGKAQAALAPLERAVALEPRFESVYYYLGRAQVELGQDAAGMANLKRASAAPNDTTLNTLAFYQLARAYRRQHRIEEADAALAQFRTLRDAAEKAQADRRAAKIDKHRELPREEQIPTEGEPSPN
jgi:tetratricopeptide (TPR) repeat protein